MMKVPAEVSKSKPAVTVSKETENEANIQRMGWVQKVVNLKKWNLAFVHFQIATPPRPLPLVQAYNAVV